MDKDKFDFLIDGEKITIETGELAKAANGSVLIRYRDNVLLITATMSNPRPGIDFFPLIVDLKKNYMHEAKYLEDSLGEKADQAHKLFFQLG
ncbi:MAG: hypothetical protein ACJZ9C_00135 [Dehalococcoidia bacterium]